MCFIVFVQELVNRSVPYSNIFVLSLSLSSFSLSSVVAAFLRLFLSRALPHYDSPSFLCSYVLNLRPPPLLPISAVERLTLYLGSASLDPIISSSTPSAPVTDFAISFLCRFPRLSSSLSSLSLSRSILSLPSPRSSVYLPRLLRPSPRVLIWPPGVQLLVSFSLQFFRRRIFTGGRDGEKVLINLRATRRSIFRFFFRDRPFALIHRPESRPAPW